MQGRFFVVCACVATVPLVANLLLPTVLLPPVCAQAPAGTAAPAVDKFTLSANRTLASRLSSLSRDALVL